jgi:hypothetical protein
VPDEPRYLARRRALPDLVMLRAKVLGVRCAHIGSRHIGPVEPDGEGANRPGLVARRMRATTALESRPPLRSAPPERR